LPEHLFLEDFIRFLKKSNREAYGVFTQVFSTNDHTQALKQAITDVTLQKEFALDNPITEKLTLYTLAHRNYLASLTL
jgi:hypothetical protein